MAILFGDTPNSLNKKQHGANQTLIGSDPTNSLFGDAGLNLLDKAHGGDDTLLTLGRETSMAMLEGILPTVRREAMTY